MVVTFWVNPPLRTWPVVIPNDATEDEIWAAWYAQIAYALG